MDANDIQEIEANLIDQSLSGNRDAFDELVRRHYPGVVKVVYWLCGEAGLAEDMTQEAFLKAWIKLPSFQKGASFRNWLYRIAVNATLDVLRRKTEEPVDLEKMQLHNDQFPGPEQALINSEQAAEVQEVLDSLPEAARSVLVLREYSGLPYHEIASVLDIPIGTVMSRLNYARNSVRKKFFAQKASMEYENA